MAFPTAVNDQVTDSVTQVNTKVVADAPGVATANLYEVTSQALGNAAHAATSHMAQNYVTAQAATTQGVASLLTLDTAATGTAAQQIAGLSNS